MALFRVGCRCCQLRFFLFIFLFFSFIGLFGFAFEQQQQLQHWRRAHSHIHCSTCTINNLFRFLFYFLFVAVGSSSVSDQKLFLDCYIVYAYWYAHKWMHVCVLVCIFHLDNFTINFSRFSSSRIASVHSHLMELHFGLVQRTINWSHSFVTRCRPTIVLVCVCVSQFLAKMSKAY